ncbi:MAG TPA: hypothetical protein ENI48_10690 [Thioploca sp.]|nr:MAG: hypothetical protein B6247_05415 [Beggiatoa sp. 4572_84]HEC85690.1 hypothetical protein [Thioploca sp.]
MTPQIRCTITYDVPEVHRLYAPYQIKPVTSYSGMKSKSKERVLNQEVLISNFLPSTELTQSLFGMKNEK